jgi:hypothetical protein
MNSGQWTVMPIENVSERGGTENAEVFLDTADKRIITLDIINAEIEIVDYH